MCGRGASGGRGARRSVAGGGGAAGVRCGGVGRARRDLPARGGGAVSGLGSWVERCARPGGARTRCAGYREVGRGRKAGADVKDTLPASGARGREGWRGSKGHIQKVGNPRVGGVRRGRKDTLVRLRCNPRPARAAEGLLGGRMGDLRWAHASPRAGEAHALGARGGRAHPGGGVRNRARRTRGL